MPSTRRAGGHVLERLVSDPSVQARDAVSALRMPWPSLTHHVNQLIMSLPGERAHAIARNIAEQAVGHGVWLEEAGTKAPIRLSIRPRLMDLACRGYVHHASWQIRTALRRVVRLAAIDPAARGLLPLDGGEQSWFDGYRRLDSRYASPRGERIFCRLDALGRLDGEGWRQSLKFLEVNVVGIGGMTYSPAAEDLLLEHMIPALSERDGELTFDKNWDPRTLLLDELTEHARTMGSQAPPTIALVDDKSLYTLGGELGRLVSYYESIGADALYLDPRELEHRAGEVYAEGRRIDVIYRFLELRDLVELEAAGDDLAALRAGFAKGIVVPSAGGDLEHKSAFELLTSPEFRAAFDADTLQVLDDHVLWTRLLFERRTTDPAGTRVELAPYVLENQRLLALKPNRTAGGEGVILGNTVDEHEWHTAVSAALDAPKSHVVQTLAPVDLEEFPVLGDDGCLELQRFFCVAGFYPGRRGLGVFGRYAPSCVVNIQAGGGISPFLVSVR